MRKFRFEKLVRNDIPRQQQAHGSVVQQRILSNAEYIEQLKHKLVEEAGELHAGTPDELVAELADVQEVIDCLLAAIGHTKADLEAAQTKKTAKNGSFNQRIYVESVEVADNDPWVEYYLNNADRYPEVSGDHRESN